MVFKFSVFLDLFSVFTIGNFLGLLVFLVFSVCGEAGRALFCRVWPIHERFQVIQNSNRKAELDLKDDFSRFWFDLRSPNPARNKEN